MIKFKIGVVNETIKQWNFPCGEVGVKIERQDTYPEAVEEIYIKAHLKNSDDVMSLLMASDALKRQYKNAVIHACIPYIPYARQDRVCNSGESLSAAVIARLINSCGFASVKVYDPHSDVIGALIDNLTVVSQVDVFRNVKSNWNDVVIIAPDAGAYKKCYKFAEAVNAKDVVACNKIRDLSTGRIKELDVSNIPEHEKLFVLDDIGDGMATFIALAEAVAGMYIPNIELAITHGIFTKGVDCFANHFDKIYTTTSYHGVVPEALKHDQIKWMEV